MKRAGKIGKRLAAAALGGALAVLLAAATAHGATQTRYYQDRGFSGSGGELRLDVVFKDKNGNRKFTPRRLTLWYTEIVPVTCMPGGDQFLAQVLPTSIKFYKGKFVFPMQDDDFDGQSSGKVYRKGKRMNGSFIVRDFDPGPGVMNCTTNGPRAWDAERCRKPNQSSKLPVCRF